MTETRRTFKQRNELQRSHSQRISLRNRLENYAFSLFSRAVRLVFQVIYRLEEKNQELPDITDPILLESATSLAHKIRTRQLKSVHVVKAYIRRLEEINPLLNCCVDERFTAAINEATEVDHLISSGEYTDQQLQKEKPFLGVPITIKDSIFVKGLLCTAGLHARKHIRAESDAEVTALMREAGAIPFAVTNVSELCMWWDTYNIVYGRTRNPYNSTRTVGGSSGGEGCALAAAASPLGIGSDIGGSIRMPAFFNGIFGHKPSQVIVSNRGQYPPAVSEKEDEFLCIGPMSRYAEDLKPALKVLAGKNASKLNLDEPVDLQKMRYFYQEDDGGGRLISPVDDDMRDAMRRVVKYLNNFLKESRVERIQIEQLRESSKIWGVNVQDDSEHDLAVQLGNYEMNISPPLELVKWIFRSSRFTFISLITAILENITAIKYGSSEWNKLSKLLDELRDKMREVLGDDGVFIYPTHPTVAPYHSEPIFRPLNFSYTAIFNALGFPATAVPLGIGSKGLPVGVQIIANINQDRLCLAVAEELERGLGGWVPPGEATRKSISSY